MHLPDTFSQAKANAADAEDSKVITVKKRSSPTPPALVPIISETMDDSKQLITPTSVGTVAEPLAIKVERP